ncbi:hypothetical protein DPMN_032861 [Dreissena polymorpha]|uniref:Essential MCU regulator, mitochondrial n=1 Tax=Dreissena polymorpha TaxID=45954 RepID=A0A9D4M504_DREPO|nr:hypothetical protein DPMN_032861 [Dreissena polymorpha]
MQIRSRGNGNAPVLLQQLRSMSSVTTSIPGPIPAAPMRKSLSIPKVSICIFIGVFTGQHAAKRLAAFLEETEMFVPEDEDD